MSALIESLTALRPPAAARAFIVPGLLAAGLVLGGASQQNAMQTAALQLAAVLCLLWLTLDTSLEPMPRAARPVIWVACGFIGLAALHLAPLPPELWTRLPGRDAVASGFAVLGGPLPWLPLSLAPEQTVRAALGVLAPLAIFVAAVKLPWRQAFGHMTLIIPLLAVASLGLGVIQALDGQRSPFYLYENTNRGWPVGFYANINHQASFLLMALPFTAALAGKLRQRRFGGEGVLELALLAATAAVLLIAGILACGSIAGYIMLGPVLLASFFVALGRGGKAPSGRTLGLIAFGLLALGAVMSTSPFVLGSNLNSAFNTGPLSRIDLWPRVVEALGVHWIAGSGLGSFELVYPQFEDPMGVTSRYANHAHNEFLEVPLEGGVAGAAMALFVIGFWFVRAGAVFSRANSEDSRLARAAAIACGVLLFHSIVDYPLRTFASSMLAALCLAMMVSEKSRGEPKAQPGGLDPEKHITL